MLILVASASAHVPHDTMRALAAPVDLDADAPWLAIADPQEVYLLLRSDDGGARWSMVGGAPTAGALLDGTMLSGGEAVLLGTDTLWWARDGADWASIQAPDGARFIGRDGDTLLVVASEGVFAGTPDGTLEAELEVDVKALAEGPVAVSAEDRVWRREGGTWVDEGSPARGLTAGASGLAGTYAGDAAGGVWRLDSGTWSACGALPTVEEPRVVNLAVTDDAVYVATATRAPFRSDDACASWTDVNVGFDTDFGSSGGAAGLDDAWPVLAASGAHVVVGGWAGLYVSEDLGGSWESKAIIPADYTRGLAFGAGFGDDRRVFVGTYGAGVAITGDGGESYTAPGAWLTDANVQHIDVAETGAEVVYAVVGHTGWASSDAGATWQSFGGDSGGLVAWESPEHVWTIGSVGTLSETTDGGDTWTPLTQLLEVLGTSQLQGTGVLAGRPCVTGIEPPRLVCEDDGVWTELFVGEGGAATDPFDHDGRLLFGEDAGVRVSDDGGATWSLVELAVDDPLVALTRTDDGTLFAATRSAQLLRSDDGGDSWVAVGDRLTARVHVLTPRPGYAEHPDLLVGTHDGTWLVHGDDLPVRWSAYQRLDAQSALVTCTACPESREDLHAGMLGIQPLHTGSVLSAWVRGTRLRVLGESDGVAVLRVDDAEVAAIGAGSGVLADVEVAEGWHRVEVEGSSVGVAIDALEGFGPGAYLDLAEEAGGDGRSGDKGRQHPAPDCGCGGGEAGGVLLTLSLVRRRKRPSR